MKRRPINVSGVADPATRAALEALKENVEVITGRRGTRITTVSTDASTTDLALKVNEILARLQDVDT